MASTDPMAFIGQIEIDSTYATIACDGFPGTLTEGTYDLYNYDNPLVSFLDILVDALSTISSKTITYSISSAGKLTLSGSATFSITLPFYAELGLSASYLSGNSTYTGTNYLRYCWFPEKSASKSLSPIANQGIKKTVLNQTISEDSTIYSTKFGMNIFQEYEFQNLSKAKTWNVSNNNGSLEEFYDDVLSVGQPFTVYPSWTNDKSINFDYVANLTEDEMKDFSPTPTQEPIHTAWTTKLSLIGA